MSVRCKRCNRVLRNPLFKAIGYGAVCAGKEGIVIPSSLKAAVRKTMRRGRKGKTGDGAQGEQLKGQLNMFDHGDEEGADETAFHTGSAIECLYSRRESFDIVR